jgi:hypothetical protein
MSNDEKVQLWQSFNKYQKRAAKVATRAQKPLLLHLRLTPSFVEPADWSYLRMALAR